MTNKLLSKKFEDIINYLNNNPRTHFTCCVCQENCLDKYLDKKLPLYIEKCHKIIFHLTDESLRCLSHFKFEIKFYTI